MRTGSLGRDIPFGKGLTRVWGFQGKRSQAFPTGPLVLLCPDQEGGVESAPGAAPLSVVPVCSFLELRTVISTVKCAIFTSVNATSTPLRQSREEKLEKPPSSAGMPCPALCLSSEQVLWLRYFHEI